jgi:vitamin B12 transporter
MKGIDVKLSLLRLCSITTISAVTVLSASSSARAEETERLEPVVVTASRIATSQDNVAQSITVVEPTEADRKSGRLVYDLLRTVPGINVINTGGPGQSTTVQVRGANSEQTLVLLDGVPMNDPTNAGRGFDFAQLTAHEVERIEVLRGAQSGVHGNNSTGGVIQIITRRAGADSRASIRGDYGAFNSKRLSGSAGGSLGNTRVAASALFEESDGFPAANAAYGNTIKNGFQRWTGTLALDHDFTKELDGSLTARLYRADTSLPYNGGSPGVGTGQDPNYAGKDGQAAIGGKVRYKKFSHWEPSLAVGLNLVVRRFDNLPDSVNTDMLAERYRGRRFKIDQSNTFELANGHTLVTGLDTQIETITVSQDYGSGVSTIEGKSQAISGLFTEYRWDAGQGFITAAARADRFHGRSDQLTYRVGPGYRMLDGALLAKASVGKGFKLPSLFQLYSSFGDPSLRSEKSRSWDAGLEYSVRESSAKTLLSASCFDADFTDLIDYSAGKFVNIRSAGNRGVEFSASHRRDSGFGLEASYTYQQARNAETGKQLPRRPTHLLSARAAGPLAHGLEAGLSLRYTGARADVDPAFPYPAVRMPSYTLLNADASYTIGQGYKAFGRLDNVLNRQYEEVAGYGTAGRSLYFGLQKDL